MGAGRDGSAPLVANLWQYGSFESGSVLDDVNLCTTAFSSAQAWVGTRSVATTISGTLGFAWAGRTSAGNTTYLTSVTNGSTYTASIYVRTAASSNSLACLLAWMDGSGNWVADSATTFSQVSANTWTRLTCTGTAQSTFAGIWLEVQSPTTNGSVIYTDGWQLETGSTATAWVPGPNDPTGTLPAPANLHSTAITATTVSIAWNAVTGASGYEVTVAADTGYNSDGVAVRSLSVAPSTATAGATMTATYTIQTNQSVTFTHLCAAVRDSANIDAPTLDFANEDSLTVNNTTHAHTITRSWDHADTFHTHIAYQIGTGAWAHITTPTINTVITGSGSSVARVGFSPGGYFDSQSGTDLTHECQQMQTMGVKWLRHGFDDFGNYSNVLSYADTLTSYRINTLAVIGYTPLTNYQTNCYNFAVAAIQHGIRYFEIRNEANIDSTFANGTDYTNNALKPGYTGIKQAGTEAGVTTTVLFTGLAPGGNAAMTYVDDIYAAGGGPYFDAANIHPYTWPNAPTDGDSSWNLFLQIPTMRQKMIDNGDSAKNIWVTEIGWPSGGGSGSVSEQTQSDMVGTFYSDWFNRYDSYSGPVLWYCLRDMGQSGTEGYFGVEHQDFSAKPAFSAMAPAFAAVPARNW
jgi:hypothetical protein